jgi:CII-binding regulator of phage lambda lysogenization HflD
MIEKDLKLSVGNIIWIVGIIFTMGIAYSQIAQLDEDIVVLENRLEKKIKIINECEDRIIELEKELARMGNCKHMRK